MKIVVRNPVSIPAVAGPMNNSVFTADWFDFIADPTAFANTPYAVAFGSGFHVYDKFGSFHNSFVYIFFNYNFFLCVYVLWWHTQIMPFPLKWVNAAIAHLTNALMAVCDVGALPLSYNGFP